MKDNVIQFKPRPRPVASPEAGVEEARDMLAQSAVMTLIATLTFYARGGWDEGRQARAALPAMGQLLATKGIPLPFPFKE